MTRLHVLIASLILVSAPLAGCLSEELVDEVLGCMDENAANYDDNATAEALGDCLYMASMEVFLQALDDEMSLESMLEETPRAGYSEVVSINEWNEDMGMQMDITMEEHVMVDLANVSVMVRTVMSMPPMLTMDYQFIQVGQVVNIHSTMSGMMNEDGPISHSAQTRDADASSESVLETVYSMLEGSMMDSDELGGDDEDDITDDMPADAEMTFSVDESDDTQMMSMSFTEDGTETAISIKIDEGNDLSSYALATDNGSATMSMLYTVYWDDAVVIEVDETLPRTSIPIWVDMAHDEDSDDGEGMFPCDNGNEVPWDYVNDGWDDCGDGSDEFDDDGDDGDGPPTPEEAMESVDANGDGYMSYQEFQDSWDSDPENPELDYDEVTILFDDCDYDDSDLIDIDEMQCFIDGIVDMLPDEGDEDDDGDDEDPEQMFGHIDTDDDGYVSIQDIIDFSNEGGDDSDDEVDEEELSDWFSWCDTDGDDLLNLDEFTTCVEDDDGDDGDDGENDVSWMNYDWGVGYCEWNGNSGDEETVWWCKYSEDDEDWDTWWYYCEHHDSDWHCTDDFGQSEEFEHSADGDEWSGSDDDDDGDDGDETFICDNGDEVPMDWVNDGWDDCGDGSDEFDDGGDDDQHEMPAVLIGYIAKNQTLNAPISDFETHFLSDCDEEYDEETGEMVEPDLDECTVEFSIPLSGGEANGVTHTYDDLDGDGLVSPGDMLTLEGWDGQTRLEMYDTWASEYSSDSVANPPALPGFGAMLAVMTLLGAAFASRRD
jgi:Ca2+-binding EF-hand superfamily protein